MSQADSSALRIAGADSQHQLLQHQKSQAFTVPDMQKGAVKSSVYLTEIHERTGGIESDFMSHE